jgi:cell division protein FtsQ
MSTRINIKKVLVFTGWGTLGAGLIVLLMAAVQTKSTKACAGLEVVINDGKEHLYTDVARITTAVKSCVSGELKGKALKDLDLRKIEEVVERDAWVQNAEVFLDNDRMLQVHIEEAHPVARVFTVHGDTYYIDSSLHRLPVNEFFSPRLPVFTDFPQEKGNWRGKDSLLMVDIAHLAAFIGRDPFWMAQVDQVDINAHNEFEIMPKVGDHVVVFGDGSDIEGKFHRLRLFYEQVLSRKGWGAYGRVDVQYRGQVVATRNNVKSSLADTAQARQWLKQWMQNSQHTVLSDTLSRAHTNLAPVKAPNPDPPTHSMNSSSAASRVSSGKPGAAGVNPAPAAMGKKTPKAVMPVKPAKTETHQKP